VGVVGPEVAGVDGVGERGDCGSGGRGVVEAVGSEQDGLVDLRLAERERQERPRRVPLRLAPRRRRRHCRDRMAWLRLAGGRGRGREADRGIGATGLAAARARRRGEGEGGGDRIRRVCFFGGEIYTCGFTNKTTVFF
jgi:hypothetical protein